MARRSDYERARILGRLQKTGLTYKVTWQGSSRRYLLIQDDRLLFHKSLSLQEVEHIALLYGVFYDKGYKDGYQTGTMEG